MSPAGSRDPRFLTLLANLDIRHVYGRGSRHLYAVQYVPQITELKMTHSIFMGPTTEKPTEQLTPPSRFLVTVQSLLSRNLLLV